MYSPVIVSVDPGGTTGLAQLRDGQFHMSHIGPDEHHHDLWNKLLVARPDILIWEEFQYQRRPLDKGVSLEIISREYIGICKLYVSMMNISGFESTLNKLKFWDDQKLKTISLWSSVIHERDALRHLLYYLTFDLKDQTWIKKLQTG